MNKLTFILILFTSIAFSQNATIDKDKILIGEQIKFTISNKIDKTKSWPTFNEYLIEGIEIIKYSSIDTVNDVIHQNFIITSWDTGTYYIPSIKFSLKDSTESLIINVETIKIEEGAQLKDIKQPINEPIGLIDILPWIIAVIIISIIIYLIKKYIFNKSQQVTAKKPKIITPPYVIALNNLNKLESEKIWQKGEIKKYHSKLSEIIRRYIEGQFNFIALELTTNEILEKLVTIINTEQLNHLKILLERADLAKFAKSKPLEHDNNESMSLAKKFVNSTKKLK